MKHIYARYHKSYGKHIKLGKAECPISRDCQYATGELTRGNYLLILEIIEDIYDYSECELILQRELSDFHVQYDGGTEFYKIEILNKIKDILDAKLLNHILYNY